MIRQEQAQSIGQFVHDTLRGGCMPVEAIAGDLMGINAETLMPTAGRFRNISYSARYHLLKIDTEPITLEGVEFGAFQFQFHLVNLGSNNDPNSVCHIHALNPNRYAPSHNAHPHVQARTLCYGDGLVAAQNALRRGDLASIARIGNAALHVYNPVSPFVKLHVYRGPQCFDCGGTVATSRTEAREMNTRRGIECICGQRVCGNCLIPCSRCNSHLCAECSSLSVTLSNGDVVRFCKNCGLRCISCNENYVLPVNEFAVRINGETYYRCASCSEWANPATDATVFGRNNNNNDSDDSDDSEDNNEYDEETDEESGSGETGTETAEPTVPTIRRGTVYDERTGQTVPINAVQTGWLTND